MHVSADGMVGTQKGPTHFNWDDELRQYSVANTENVDFILLGRKTATDFIPHWKSVAENPENPDFAIGRAITDMPKIVFSKTVQKSEWTNTKVQKDLVESVSQLKKQGKNLLAYGGHDFVASLIQHDLIDEYDLLMNPVLLHMGRQSRKDCRRSNR